MEQDKSVNEKDVEVLQKYFKDNERLLRTMRRVFYGLSLTDEQKKTIKETFADERLFLAVRRKFLPELDLEIDDVEIGKVQDLWLGVEQNIFGHGVDAINQTVSYKFESIEMVRKALALLKEPDSTTPVDISYNPNLIANDPLQIKLLARNMYIRHVEAQLLSIWIIAGEESKSPEDIKKMLAENSTK